MNDCIFCKIIKGEIPSSKLYEDEHTYAFLDIFPVNNGHALVIPKKHYTDFLDMPDEELKHLMSATKKVTNAILKAVNADGFNLGMNNKKAAGQVVFHAHIHIMPRFENDGYKLWQGKEKPKEEMEKIKQNILENLKNDI